MFLTLLNFILFYRHFKISLLVSLGSLFIWKICHLITEEGVAKKVGFYVDSYLAMVWLLVTLSTVHVVVIKLVNKTQSVFSVKVDDV